MKKLMRILVKMMMRMTSKNLLQKKKFPKLFTKMKSKRRLMKKLAMASWMMSQVRKRKFLT
jgi:hypothetical protein